MDLHRRQADRYQELTPEQRWIYALRSGEASWALAFQPGYPLAGCMLMAGLPKENEGDVCGRWRRIKAGQDYMTGKPMSNRALRKAKEAEKKAQLAQAAINKAIERRLQIMEEKRRIRLGRPYHEKRNKQEKQITRGISRALRDAQGQNVKLGARGYFIWEDGRHVNYTSIKDLCQKFGNRKAIEIHRSCLIPAINM